MHICCSNEWHKEMRQVQRGALYCQNPRLLKQLAVYQFTSFKENKPKPTNHHAPGHGQVTVTQHISHVPHISQVSHISLPLFHLSHTPTVPFSLAKVTSWNHITRPSLHKVLAVTNTHPCTSQSRQWEPTWKIHSS